MFFCILSRFGCVYKRVQVSVSARDATTTCSTESDRFLFSSHLLSSLWWWRVFTHGQTTNRPTDRSFSSPLKKTIFIFLFARDENKVSSSILLSSRCVRMRVVVFVVVNVACNNKRILAGRESLSPSALVAKAPLFFIFLYLAVNNSPIFSVRVCLFDPACRLVFFVCSKVVKKRFNFLRLKHEETNTRPVFLSLSPSCSSAQLCVYTSKVNDRSTRGPFFLLTYASFFSLSNKLLKKKKKRLWNSSVWWGDDCVQLFVRRVGKKIRSRVLSYPVCVRDLFELLISSPRP